MIKLMKTIMISIGEFLFRYRNQVFPLIIVALFVLAAPSLALFDSKALEQVKDWVALLIALSGLVLRATVIGYVYIRRGGHNKSVYASDLITEGMFAVCRNPLYVGNMLIYASIFLMHGHPIVVIAGIGLFAFMYKCIVLAEEAYLEEKFRDGYRDYRAAVPRWLPRFSRFAEATEGMTFKFRRVLLKDYSTVGATLIALSLVKIYERIVLPDPLQYTGDFVQFGFLIVVLSTLTGLVSYCKKRGYLAENKP